MGRISSTARAAPRERRGLAEALLPWFDRARRDLPWREEPRDPYRTWVSEVMLQQTRVEVVVPYYLRFLSRFPTLRALAEAPLDDVLAHWSGLGYYARARNLHRAARAAASEFGGALPRTAAGLSTLPGFGPYTAAAVASLAFGEDVALVDGNVARVLARVLLLPGDAAQARAAAWVEARALLPAGRAGAFNEALMELGATLCTPRAPRCEACPVAASCAARAQGDPEAFPAPTPRKARPSITWAAVAVRRDDGAVLLARRPPGSLFEGMWDLPSAEVAPRAGPPSPRQGTSSPPQGPPRAGPPAADLLVPAEVVARRAAVRTLRGLARDTGACFSKLDRARPALVEQTLTHRELRVLVFSARATGGAHRPGGAPRAGVAEESRGAEAPPEVAAPRGDEALRWVAPTAAELRKVGLSSLARKCLRAAGMD